MIRPQQKAVRIVDRKYREFVKGKTCLLSSTYCVPPIDPHHYIPKGEGRTGSKVSDRMCVPLCRHHHEIVEANPNGYRETCEYAIARLNKEYDTLFPAKEKRERKTSARVRKIEIECPCKYIHKVSKYRVDDADSVIYYCPFLKKDQVASFRRRSA